MSVLKYGNSVTGVGEIENLSTTERGCAGVTKNLGVRGRVVSSKSAENKTRSI